MFSTRVTALSCVTAILEKVMEMSNMTGLAFGLPVLERLTFFATEKWP